MLGGHDIVHQPLHMSCRWHCRVCRRSAKKRESLCFSRCPGSAVQRWARAAALAAASAEPAGGEHYLLLSGSVVWCWKCGAYACARARLLAQPCPGQARGFRKQAWQRLLLGLHPSSRVPLGADAVPEPGRPMPAGFASAVRGAEASGTRAASCCQYHHRQAQDAGLGTRRDLVVTPRLAALRSRIAAKEAAASRSALASGRPSKKRRLRGKQPDPTKERLAVPSLERVPFAA